MRGPRKVFGKSAHQYFTDSPADQGSGSGGGDITVGERTATDIALLYIKDIANPQIVGKIKGHIERIQIDAILESGYLEQLLKNQGLSIFPQMQTTERPDKVAAGFWKDG